MKKSTYIKLISFGLLKKALFIYLLTQTHLFGADWYQDVYFTDYEEKATLYMVNYYPYQHLKDIYLGSTDSKDIIKKRPFGDLYDLDDAVSMNSKQWNYLRQDSHLVDWNIYTDDFGMTLHQTNFMYALVGALLGFTFLFFFIFIIAGSL